MTVSTLQLRPRRLPVLLAVGLVASLVLGACSTGPVERPDEAVDNVDEFRSAVDARLDDIDDGRFSNVTLEYFGDGERVRVNQLLIVERPDRLRVETRLPGSDEMISLLVSDGETFSLHEREDNKYYTGEPTRENINRLLPVDLSGRDVVQVMLGGAPWDRFDREAGSPTVEWDEQRGTYRYGVDRRNGNELVMYVRHDDFAVVEVEETDTDGEMVYSYVTENWEDLGDIELPTYQRFQWPERDLDFSLDVSHTEVNVEFTPGINLFEFAPPPGSTIVEVDS